MSAHTTRTVSLPPEALVLCECGHIAHNHRDPNDGPPGHGCTECRCDYFSTPDSMPLLPDCDGPEPHATCFWCGVPAEGEAEHIPLSTPECAAKFWETMEPAQALVLLRAAPKVAGPWVHRPDSPRAWAQRHTVASVAVAWAWDDNEDKAKQDAVLTAKGWLLA